MKVKLQELEKLIDGRFIATFVRLESGEQFKVVGPAEDWPDEIFDTTPTVDDDESDEIDQLLAEEGLSTDDLQWVDIARSDWDTMEKARLLKPSPRDISDMIGAGDVEDEERGEDGA